MARDRPSPYGEGVAALTTVARGPVPRERCRKGRRFFPVARGPGPRDLYRHEVRLGPLGLHVYSSTCRPLSRSVGP